MKRCLVTGANGFVGANVIRALIENGYNPIAFVRPKTNLENLKGLEIEIREGDLRDRDSVSRAMRGINYVFHVGAAYLFWAKNTDLFYETNIKGTLNVIEEALKSGVERIVYTSTTGAIGLSRDSNPIDETVLENPPKWYFDPWNLGDHYARSKILAQKEVIRKIKEGADIVIVCPSAPIGWGDYKPTPTGLLILKFLNREIPFYSDVGFSFVNAKDVARGHVLALEKGKKGEIYILGGHNIFLSEFFDILSRITGLKKPLRLPRGLSSFLGQVVGFILELWAKISGNPPLITRAQARASLLNLFYSSEKAIRELGYTISPIEDAVKDAIRYFLEKGMVKRKIKEKIEGKI
jgi:dihydroflavonol-4-reductase